MTEPHVIRVGWVYLIGTSERVKIGHSKSHPSLRREDLQAGSPVPLGEIGLLPGTQLIERMIHAYLHEHRWIREWFDRVPLVNDFIREIALPWSAAFDGDYYGEVPRPEYTAFHLGVRDRIAGWFEARGVAMGSLPPERRKGKLRPVAVRTKGASPPFPVLDASGCPTDYETAMRPDRLLREALAVIEPQWRFAFLRHVRGEPVGPGLLPHLAENRRRLIAVEAAFGEASERMRRVAESLEPMIDVIPYAAPAP